MLVAQKRGGGMRRRRGGACFQVRWLRWCFTCSDPVKLYGREAARWPLSVFSGAQPRQNAKMRDDPTEFMLRKREVQAHANTQHLDDCVATQTSSLGGWNAARSSPRTHKARL